ncbi:MAG: hypothetical protein ABI429_02570 [Jatrophihabitantaceae bacterium]
MHGTRLIHCACCGLDQNASDDRSGHRPWTSCVRCAGHRGDSIEAFARREAEHAAMSKHALVDAQDDTILARSERDHYRDRMKTAYASRELLVQALSRIDDVHHYRGKRCVCGTRGCRVAALLADPKIARLIRTFDEERRTLRELRNANAEAWTDKWDYIDVTLVYPTHERRRGPGRHRAAG